MEPDSPFPIYVVCIPEQCAAISAVFRLMEKAHLAAKLSSGLPAIQIIASQRFLYGLVLLVLQPAAAVVYYIDVPIRLKAIALLKKRVAVII